MKERLKRRLPLLNEDEIDFLASFIETHGIQLTINNLDEHGLILYDLKGRSVRICFSEWRRGQAQFKVLDADIAIIVIDGIVGGWVESSAVENLEDRYSINLSLLHPMPKVFSFDRTCSHLSDHGGFYEGEHWECAGCGEYIIF